MRQQFSRWVPLHLLTLMSLLLNLMPSFAPRTFAAETPTSAAPAAALLAPSIPDPLVAPFVDPARAALTAALGTTDPTLLPNAAPTRLEPLAPVVPAAPAVTRPVQPNPLAHLNSGAPQAAGLDNLTQQRANPAATDTLTPTVSRTTEASRAPPVMPTVSTDTAAVSPAAPAAATVSSSASATSPVTATLAPTAALRLFLPLIQSTNAAPTSAAQETLQVTPEQGGTLRSADGQVELVIPAGAVTSAITISYQALAEQPVAGFRSAGVRFALTAVDAQGQFVHQFLRDLTLRVRYVPQAGLDAASLKLYFTDATHPDWTALPSVVEATANRLVATSTHFTNFALLQSTQAPTDPTPCELAEIAYGVTDSSTRQAFIQACDAYTLNVLGAIKSPIYTFGGAEAQKFEAGTLLRVNGTFYYLQPAYVDMYQAEGGPAGWLGAPQTGANPTQAFATFTDENGHNFVGQDVFFLAKGFISKNNGTTVEAHRFFPNIPGIGTINVNGELVRHTVVVPGQPDTYTYTVKLIKFATGVDPAPQNPGGASVNLTLIVEAEGQQPWTKTVGAGPSSVSFDYPYELNLGTPVIFSFKAARTSPVGDTLVGYAPCTAFTQRATYTLSAGEGPFTYTNSCEGTDGTLPPPDTTPPVIHYMDLFQDGNGLVEVRSLVTDNRAVGTVTLTFNGASYPMQDLGGGIYRSGRLQAPRSGTNTYRIHATDTSGNAADFPTSGVISVPAGESRSFGSSIFKNSCPCGFTGSEGDPVNTQNGNFTTSATDVTVAGVGETSLSVSRAYNSLAAFGSGGGTIRYTESGGAVTQAIIAGPPQPFGRAWTFDYAVRLLLVDNLVMQGAQVFYPDGRVVSFRREGNGFAPITPFSHDALVAAGSGYELRHKDTLEVEIFDAQGRLVGRRDRNGNPVTLTYAGDRLTSVTNASGRALTFDYNGDGFIAAIHAPEGKSLTYAYTNGDLTSVTDARGNTTTYAYNAQHQLTQITTPEGHPSLRLSYDDQYRVKEQIVGATERHTFSYSADGSLTTLTEWQPDPAHLRCRRAARGDEGRAGLHRAVRLRCQLQPHQIHGSRRTRLHVYLR